MEKLRHKGLGAIYLGLDSYLLSQEERLVKRLSVYDPLSHNLDAAKHDIEQLLAGESIDYFEYMQDVGKKAEKAKRLKFTGPILLKGCML